MLDKRNVILCNINIKNFKIPINPDFKIILANIVLISEDTST